MVLVQPDFAGKVSCLEGEDAREEFQRIFGFPAEYIIVSAMRGLRPVHEADHLHSQASAEGSGFYHAFVSGVETEIDMLDQWEAEKSIIRCLRGHIEQMALLWLLLGGIVQQVTLWKKI